MIITIPSCASVIVVRDPYQVFFPSIAWFISVVLMVPTSEESSKSKWDIQFKFDLASARW